MSFDAPLHSHIECEALQLYIGLKLLFTLSSFSLLQWTTPLVLPLSMVELCLVDSMVPSLALVLT
jgi:hypothetical protein